MIATMKIFPSTHPCGCFHPPSMEAKFLIFSISCLLIFICSPYIFYLMCITLAKHSFFLLLLFCLMLLLVFMHFPSFVL
jgi:hypothetical protein